MQVATRSFTKSGRPASTARPGPIRIFRWIGRLTANNKSARTAIFPLDRQQEHKVVGFFDEEKWKPILEPNPAFDPDLQHEGVTCAACHLKNGKILGPFGSVSTAHPVEKLANPNEICFKCHVVGGNRWDTFFRFPPCGTVADIAALRALQRTSQSPPQTTRLATTPASRQRGARLRPMSHAAHSEAIGRRWQSTDGAQASVAWRARSGNGETGVGSETS